MSSFPPAKWQVRHLKDMELYEPVPPEKSKLYMEALLAARPASGHEGSYRLALSGQGQLSVEFKLSLVWNDEELNKLTVVADLPSGSVVKLQKNSNASRWTDVEELVKEQEVDVVDENGDDAADKFLAAWDRIKKVHPLGDGLGLSWRWALTTKEDCTGMELWVQALPLNLNYIKNRSEYRQDDTPAIVVASFPVDFEVFESEAAAGPVPVFFSEDPESTSKYLKDSPEFALACLQALVNRLLALEDITK